jgi:hypothetical protein
MPISPESINSFLNLVKRVKTPHRPPSILTSITGAPQNFPVHPLKKTENIRDILNLVENWAVQACTMAAAREQGRVIGRVLVAAAPRKRVGFAEIELAWSKGKFV